MTTVAKKLLLGTAAFAVAGALISPVVAIAETEDTGTDSASVGTSAGSTPKRSGRGAKKSSTPAVDSPAAPVVDAPEIADIPTVGADATADASAFDNPLFQNPLIWLGTPNPNPPTPVAEFETFPLEDVDGPLRGAFGWMEDFEFEACVLGLSSVTRGQTVAGPYGTATTGFSSSGCA